MLKGRWCCFKGLPSQLASLVKEKNEDSINWDKLDEMMVKAEDLRLKAYLESNTKR